MCGRCVSWRILRWFLVSLWALAATWTALANGSVNDEFAAHVTAGYLYLKTGKFAGGVHNPPLGQLWVASLPVLLGQPLLPFTDDAPVAARVANIVLGLLLLVAIGNDLRARKGEQAACLATLVLVATPEFTAHASLATIDLPVTVAMFGATASFIEVLRRGGWKAVCAAGLFLGIAIATKITGVLLIPMLLAMALAHIVWLRWKSPALGSCLTRAVGAKAALVSIAMGVWAYVIIWASYSFRASQGPASVTFSQHGWWQSLFPAEFFDQIMGKIFYASGGNVSYFAGVSRLGGWWWYYPAVLILKTPLPVLLVWGIASASALRGRTYRAFLLAVAALTFLSLACFNRAQIGVRHLLPVVPIFAAIAGDCASAGRVWARRLVWGLAAMGLVNWIAVLPYPLTAESVLLLGNGYRFFADSNYDWGQANKAIRELAKEGKAIRPAPYAATTGTVIVRVNEWAGHRSFTKEGYAWLHSVRPTSRIAGGGLAFEISDQLLGSQRDVDSTAARFAFSWGRSGGRTEECECSDCLDDLLTASPDLQREIARCWLHLVENACGVAEGYRLARRLGMLLPDDKTTADTRERLGLLLEAEKLDQRNPAQAALARANAAWLAGDPGATLRWLSIASEHGMPRSHGAYLGYRAAAALNFWRSALNWAKEISLEMRSRLIPSVELARRMANNQESAQECYELGMHWYQLRLWESAARAFLRALQRDPAHAPAFNMLGELIVRYKEETLEGPRSRQDPLERIVICERDFQESLRE